MGHTIKTKRMAEEELSIQMEVFMQDSFLLINLMDKVTLSLPIKIPIRELFEMVRDRVMESIISAKGQFLKVTGIEILKLRESSLSLMETYSLVSFMITREAKVSTTTKMEMFTKEAGLMTARMEGES